VWWWLERWSYTRFVLRELTSVAVAFFAVLTLLEIRALGRGPEAYAQFVARLKSPLFVVGNLVALVLVLFHSITWFNLAPKAMALRWRGKRLPDIVVAGSNYVAWAVATGIVAWILLRKP